jgi:hypothetical protein
MNSRRFTVDASVLPTERIAHLSYGRRLLRCGILIRHMTGVGQIRPPRALGGMSVIPPKAVANADIFVRPGRANS